MDNNNNVASIQGLPADDYDISVQDIDNRLVEQDEIFSQRIINHLKGQASSRFGADNVLAESYRAMKLSDSSPVDRERCLQLAEKRRALEVIILPGIEESCLASVRKSGRAETDYQCLLFPNEPRKYSLEEWCVLYCLKNVGEFCPAWTYLLEHYPGLLVKDVVMVLPAEKISLLPDYYAPQVAENEGLSITPLSLFSQRHQRSQHVEVLNDWHTISMFDPLAQVARGASIAPKA